MPDQTRCRDPAGATAPAYVQLAEELYTAQLHPGAASVVPEELNGAPDRYREISPELDATPAFVTSMSIVPGSPTTNGSGADITTAKSTNGVTVVVSAS